MPRAGAPPGCFHISLPVAASSATICPIEATYIIPSTTIGLNRFVAPVGYLHATSSCLTLLLLICLSEEYCDDSPPPPDWCQVSNGRWTLASSIVVPIKMKNRIMPIDLRINGSPRRLEFPNRREYTPCRKRVLIQDR